MPAWWSARGPAGATLLTGNRPGLPQFGGADGQLHGVRGIVFEHDVANSGIPDPGQPVRILTGDQDKTVGLLRRQTDPIQMFAIEDDYAIEGEVRLIDNYNGVPALAPEDVADTLRVFCIANGHLHGFHWSSVLSLRNHAPRPGRTFQNDDCNPGARYLPDAKSP
jgi:hypothetical protein